MDYISLSCAEFTEKLASSDPTPGGGGASALVGALGAALGNMVGSLTVNKKKYAEVQEEITELMTKSDIVQKKLLDMIELDAKAFEPLSKAYGLPKETEEQKAHRDVVMEEALDTAAQAPLEIMCACGEAIELIGRFSEIGSVIAISDAGVGAAFCEAAIRGASLNVFINTKLMKDRKKAESYNAKAELMLEKYIKISQSTFSGVKNRLI